MKLQHGVLIPELIQLIQEYIIYIGGRYGTLPTRIDILYAVQPAFNTDTDNMYKTKKSYLTTETLETKN